MSSTCIVKIGFFSLMNRFQKVVNSLFQLQRCSFVASVLILFCLPTYAQFSRGTQMTFGKARVQYGEFYWTFFRFKNFDVYSYVGGQDMAIYTGRTADHEIEEIERTFDFKITGRFQFIVYNKLSDLKQTNIGLSDEELLTNTGGYTKIIGSKVLIYFDGDYRHLREQIRGGVAQVMLNQLMYGGNIKDRIQNAVLLTLPDWYTQGLTAYIANGWSPEDDNRLRDGILSGRFRKFNRLTGEEALFAGHSLWNYIVDVYGQATVSNLLYMTRINRNIESGFIYVLGTSSKQLLKNWFEYYQKVYKEDNEEHLQLPEKPLVRVKKPLRQITQMKASPDGSKVAYVTNELGRYKIWMVDVKNKKRTRLGKGGYKSIVQATDVSFPVLAWHPTGKIITSIREKKGKLWMDYYRLDKKPHFEKSNFFYFEKVSSFNYAANGQEIVISAVLKGQSDIFTFNTRTRTYKQITKDYWEDIDPHFALNDNFIVFGSNREEDTLRTTSFKEYRDHPVHGATDIFLYNIESPSNVLTRLTNTYGVNETQPMMIDSSHFTFLSDENGIINRYIATLGSTISYIDTVIHYRYNVETFLVTDYSRNIIAQDVNARQTTIMELFRTKNSYSIYQSPLREVNRDSSLKPKNTFWREKNPVGRQTATVVRLTAPKVTVIDIGDEKEEVVENRDTSKVKNGKVDINNYVFQTEFPKKKKEEKKTEKTPRIDTLEYVVHEQQAKIDAVIDTAAYQLPKQRNYDVAFSTSYILTQLDNNLLNETYQSFTGGAVYFDPGLNGLFKIAINDLLDDYRFTGGFRLSGNLSSNEYFFSFDDLKHRLDQQFSFYRQAREEITSLSYYKIHTHEFKYTVRWPFSDLSSMRGAIAYRNDRTVARSNDIVNLERPNIYENWINTHVEYVFDNTISTGLNLYNGLRCKVFGEVFKEALTPKSYLGIIGADFRYYLKVHRQIIWANRIAASSSFGNMKLIYYLGSTDNAIVPTDNFDQNIRVDYSQNYVFQALATNLRGFKQNIRNGNSFALVNSELRIPVFQYLLNRPIRSDFIRNFQIIGFGDAGTAWTGKSPYSKGNSLFTQVYDNNPVTITVKRDIEPFVLGYGFGLRSRILGYFLRTDWAWGIDDGVVGKRIFYFSLGLDF